MEELTKALRIEIPKKAEGLLLPDPWLLEYYEGLENRVLWIEGDIEDDAIDIIKKIKKWNREDEWSEYRRPITLYINSDGGSLDMSLAVASAIRESKVPIIGHNIGSCSSGAALIFSQCTKRRASEAAYFLIHKGSGGVVGSFQQTKKMQQHYEYQIKQMSAMMAEKMGIEVAEFDQLSDSEWYLYADCKDGSIHDAGAYNLITEVE